MLSVLAVVRTVNSAFRKGVRKGLGMKQRESLSERFPDRFSEVVAKMKRQQLYGYRCVDCTETCTLLGVPSGLAGAQ